MCKEKWLRLYCIINEVLFCPEQWSSLKDLILRATVFSSIKSESEIYFSYQ